MKILVYGKEATINPENPSFNYRTGLDLPFIEVKAVIKDNSKKWKETFKVTSLEKAEEQIKEVIQFFNDTLTGSEREREFASLWFDDEEASQFKDGNGMSGWLNPEGEFFPCGFGEHNIYAMNTMQEYNEDLEVFAENQHIPMSVNDQSSFSHIGILGQITEPQLKWFNRFFDKLSSNQKSILSRKCKEQDLQLDFDW